VHTPQYTNYGYNNAAGDDESKMVAEGTKRCMNQILAARPSTRHLLDGVEVPVPHRSTEPARPRSRRLSAEFWGAPDSLVDLCTGTKHAAEIGVITKADDIVCAVHAYKAGATKNVAMRFYYAGAAL